ncbi:YfhO family protein [Candidatus Kaistella beijingensis]|uniref:YfhO family protein n=1 Tax=Candidatus Kaistella beijingensis TaxID=2820270 RepID=UPI001CC67DB7|nr:YfhO family protein [Candidatus Kaistella beijingensis]UBB89689.1 YfhO family protein [Candidatus Kaistella beijingensis]
MVKNKKLIFIIASLVLFMILALVYANPVLTGKQLFQHDIVQYKGGAKELLDYRAQNGLETYWSDSMFGGMPTYQMGAQFRGDIVKSIDGVLNFLPKPANYIFLLFSGFFLLGLVAVRNWKYALLGATFFGLSTYFYIALAAGHNGKIHTVAYFAPLLAGILLVYIRKKYILGFIVTALFMGLQVAANHPQMTYYLFIALGFLFVSELIRAFQHKISWKHFGISNGILALAMLLGVGMNSQRIMANSEYVTETVRGKQILNNDRHSSDESGMDKESMLMWSYGKMETLNLFIPRLMGGSSNEEGSDKMMARVQEMVQENVTSQSEMDRISKGFSSLTYWGEQPGTSGPAYQGAVVCFLAILGFFFAWKKYRYWILGASILTIFLAWGSNFMALSDFFIDFVPFYNKFRAPSSILVVVELLFPLVAMIGLYRFFNSNEKTETTSENILTEEYKTKILKYVSASVLGIILLLLVFGKSILGFHTDSEKTYLPPYLLDFLVDERFKMFRIDAIKAIIYVAITAGVLFLSLKKKLSQNIAIIVIGLVSLFDLWSVNKRYLNNDNFVDKAFAENPFQTENSDLLMQKVGENSNLQSLLANAKINQTLETIAEKDKTHYRIYNQTLGTFSETNTSYFKSSIGGYHAVKLRRYDDLINEYFSKMDTVKIPKILNMLNTKYMIFGNAEKPDAVVNPNANGNAWFVSNVKFVENPNEEIKQIGEIDSKEVAIISKDDQKYFEGKQLAADSTAVLNLTKYQPNELEFKTQSKTPQLAVFSEIYYPKGWKMLIDGNEVPYIKANYLLRAVHVPAGNHMVKMVFEPAVIAKGKLISMIAFGLFLLLSLGGIYWLYKNRNNQTA